MVSTVASEHCAQPLEALGTAIAQALEVVQSPLVRAGWTSIAPAAESSSALATALETALGNVRGAFEQRDSDGGSDGGSGFSEALKVKLQALAGGARGSLGATDAAGGSAGAAPMDVEGVVPGGASGTDAARPAASFFANIQAQVAQARERKRKRDAEEAEEGARDGSE